MNIERIRSNEPIDDGDARAVVALLTRIISDLRGEELKFTQAAAALRSVIGRMDSQGALTAVTDWWLVCVSGEAPVTPGAYRPPNSVPAEIARLMTSLLTAGIPSPVADSLDARRHHRTLLAKLDHDLVLENHGQLRMPHSQRQVWAIFLEDISEHIAAVRAQRVHHLPLPEQKRFRQWLKEASIIANSSIWNEMIELFEVIIATLNELRRYVDGLSNWTHVVEPTPLDDVPAPWRAGDVGLERWLLSPYVLGIERPDHELSVDDAVETVRRDAAEVDAKALTHLALLVEDWPARHHVREPQLDRALVRLSQLTKRRARLERKGHDLDELWRRLTDDHDLEGTDSDIDRLEEQIASSDRALMLRQQVDAIRQRSFLPSDMAQRPLLAVVAAALEQQGDLLPDAQVLQSVFDNVDGLIARGDLTAAQATISDIERSMVNSAVAWLQRMILMVRDDLERVVDDDGYLPDADFAARDVLQDLDDWEDRLSTDPWKGPLRELQTAMLDLAGKVEEVLRRFRTEIDLAVRQLTSTVGSLSSVLDDDTESELIRRVANLRAQVDDLADLPKVDDLVSTIDDLKLFTDDVEVLRRDRWVERWTFDRGEAVLVEHVTDYCTQQLAFDEEDITRLYVAIKCKPFVILSGLTGSGKSTIARLIAESLGASAQDGTFRRVAVRPDWIDQSEVVGHVNPIRNEFQPGWLADVVRDCGRNPGRIYFVLLDEMNLAPVEQYLAEYLSAGEERRSGATDVRLSLYPRGTSVENDADWESELRFPDNLVVIGTVNVDETTRVLSDRVIDRANVMQLSNGVTDEHHRAPNSHVRPWVVPFDEWRRTQPVGPPGRQHHNLLVEVAELMESRLRIGLGVRAHVEIERYVQHAEGILPLTDALDEAIIQRLIPKIRGYRRDLESGLEDLADLFESNDLSRSARVVRKWLDDHLPDDYFVDGMQARVGRDLI